MIVALRHGNLTVVDATPEAPHVQVKRIITIPVICRLRVENGSLAQLVELGVNNRNSCLTVVAGSSPAGATKF